MSAVNAPPPDCIVSKWISGSPAVVSPMRNHRDVYGLALTKFRAHGLTSQQPGVNGKFNYPVVECGI